jgi:ABC-type transport system involved in multi-copper enzyme maturation permease subunit
MFWNILANENTKILKRRLFWVEIVLVALIVLGILLALYITVETNRNGTGLPSEERLMLLETITWPEALVNVLRLAGWDGFGPLFLIILVGAVTAQEYTWRTLHLWLARGVPRPLLVVAKLTALLLAALLIVLTALGTGSAVTAIISSQINGSLHLEQLDLPHLFFSILRTTFTLLPYGSLAFLLAVASRSAVVAISGGLAYTLLLESLIMQVIGLLGERLSQIVNYLPGSLANNLLTLNNATLATGSSTDLGLITPFLASIGIGVWTLLFLDLSLWIFQRQDLAE